MSRKKSGAKKGDIIINEEILFIHTEKPVFTKKCVINGGSVYEKDTSEETGGSIAASAEETEYSARFTADVSVKYGSFRNLPYFGKQSEPAAIFYVQRRRGRWNRCFFIDVILNFSALIFINLRVYA